MAIRAWWDRWDEMFSGVIEETVEVIEALAERGVLQFSLTNCGLVLRRRGARRESAWVPACAGMSGGVGLRPR